MKWNNDIEGEEMDDEVGEFLNDWLKGEDTYCPKDELKPVQVVVYEEKDADILTPIIPYLTERTATEVFNVIDYRIPFNKDPKIIRLHFN